MASKKDAGRKNSTKTPAHTSNPQANGSAKSKAAPLPLPEHREPQPTSDQESKEEGDQPTPVKLKKATSIRKKKKKSKKVEDKLDDIQPQLKNLTDTQRKKLIEQALAAHKKGKFNGGGVTYVRVLPHAWESDSQVVAGYLSFHDTIQMRDFVASPCKLPPPLLTTFKLLPLNVFNKGPYSTPLLML